VRDVENIAGEMSIIFVKKKYFLKTSRKMFKKLEMVV
jgi:hypothetical protein